MWNSSRHTRTTPLALAQETWESTLLWQTLLLIKSYRAIIMFVPLNSLTFPWPWWMPAAQSQEPNWICSAAPSTPDWWKNKIAGEKWIQRETGREMGSGVGREEGGGRELILVLVESHCEGGGEGGVPLQFYKQTYLIRNIRHTQTHAPRRTFHCAADQAVGSDREGKRKRRKEEGGGKRDGERLDPGFSLPPRPIQRIFL